MNKIDFVVTWVDGNDPAWRKERAQYLPQGLCDDSELRYRDWDLLRYWFRGVEKFAPWVRKIHFVTWGHLPPWLDVSHPKLHIVRHEDYIPSEYLPVFNSNAIELPMHKIEGLSEQFIYFNDDFFPIAPLKEEDFFCDGLPRDMLAFQPVVASPDNPVMSHLFLNNILVLSKYFDKRENVKKQPGAYFHKGYPLMNLVYNMLELAFPKYSGLYTIHDASPFLKSTFEEVWEKEADVLTATMRHRFRSKDDVTIYLIREWQKLSGAFSPFNRHKIFGYFKITNDNRKLIRTIRRQKKKLICINDSQSDVDVKRAQKELRRAFESILPQPSAFERQKDTQGKKKEK